jgi:UDP-glucuronate 4-epimerase
VRDFTYIDDVSEAVVRVLDAPPANPPHRIFNVGNGAPTILLRYIEVLEQSLGIHAKKEMLPLQPGDVLVTNADVSALEREFGWRPSTPIEIGVRRFVDWYLDYYNERIPADETSSGVDHPSERHHARRV